MGVTLLAHDGEAGYCLQRRHPVVRQHRVRSGCEQVLQLSTLRLEALGTLLGRGGVDFGLCLEGWVGFW